MTLWLIFIAFIVVALALDLGVFNRSPHEIKTKEATIWTIVWVTVAVLFSGVIYLAFENKWIDFTNSNKSKLIHKRIQVFLFILAKSMKQILLIGDKNFHMS